MSSIEFNGVSKHYGPVQALHEVSMHAKENEFATILGPSGSGKTTLLSIAAGIIGPSAGQIVIGGSDVTRLPAAQRNIGLVFQSYALFPHMSVFDNVAFPLAIRRVPRPERQRRVGEILELVHLGEFKHRRPAQLSGGQQQRVALARALVFKPDILLLDEPLAALDRKLREEVRLELRRLQRSLGITTLLVTHDQDEALSLSDRIIVLQAGRVQQIDTPADLYHRPKSRFVADFLGMANFLEGELQSDTQGCGIRLNSGDFIACAAPPFPVSGRVCGMLRPEQIRLDSTSSAPNALHARILDIVFFGDATRYTLALPSGIMIMAQSTDARAAYPQGGDVYASWDPTSIWLLPHSDRA